MTLRTLSLLLVLVVHVCVAAFDPYATLGIHRRASTQDIRRAYKQLAKEWHPDKNSSPKAEEKFIQITKAYELLSDPDRRRLYDNKGITEETPNFRQRHDYSQYGRFDHHPFDSFFDDIFGDGGFRFSFGGGGGDGGTRIFHKQSITSKAYWNNVVPKSDGQPYLILFYSDWCFNCIRIQPIWTK